MTRHLSLLTLVSLMLSIANGCAPRQRGPTIEPVPVNGFVKSWSAALRLDRDPPERLFLRDDLVFLYTRGNRSYVLSAAGGELLTSTQVVPASSNIRPPALLGDKIVYPSIVTLEVYDRRGRKAGTINLERATRSAPAGEGNNLYIGLDYGNGGRLARIDITRPYAHTLWELMTFGSVSAAPATYEGTIYAASEDGRIYAVATNRDPVWPIDGNTFVTAGAIVADVKVDDFGVYVASTDSKLYCLDRITGRVKWSYYAGVPLRSAAVATRDYVFQSVPGRGMVALNKLEGQISRDPLWISRQAKSFLASDAGYIYVLMRDNSIAALDKTNGAVKFRSRRKDFVFSAVNTRDSTIYVATRKGEVLAIRPVLKPGTVGEIVFDERRRAPIDQVAVR